jgi:maltooligosyltrehalose trehalohydrolase
LFLDTIRRIGALPEPGGCRFVVWAPFLDRLAVQIVSPGAAEIPLRRDGSGYWQGSAPAAPGSRYLYRLSGTESRPDPASFLQPEGVHGPSEVVDHASFPWTDAGWRGLPLAEMVIYELHVGAFTPEGTCQAVIPRLDALKEAGINTLELMPVAQFPGERNWGYDGVYPYAVQASYGGPEGLKRLVDACHSRGMAVLLDVVYNHLGPEGNYLRSFGPYFTARYQTPWGEALNFDGAHCDPVRHFFIGNAMYWLETFHLDGLRLDAVHAMYDFGARHFLRELAEVVDEFSLREGRRRLLIAESDLNDARIVRPGSIGGYGLDAQWNDDFHHSLHTLLTGERESYYRDFGRVEHLEAVLRHSFYYDGKCSEFRQRRFGGPAGDRSPRQFVAYAQNHDQIGNRLRGDRLSLLVPPAALRQAAAAVLLSPFVPMLFMGEEYGEDNPFAFFTSHGDPELVRAIREGRKREFADFGWKEEPPDPQDPATFERSKLDWSKRDRGEHRLLLDFHRELLRLRRELPALRHLSQETLALLGLEAKRLLAFQRWYHDSRAVAVFHFGDGEVRWEAVVPGSFPPGQWRKALDSADALWGGAGSALPEVLEPAAEVILGPHQVALYRFYD